MSIRLRRLIAAGVLGGGGLSASEQLAQYIISQLNPLAYWKMDEPSGTTVSDATGNNRTGTAANVTLRETGQVGNAYKFGGVNGSKISASAALRTALDPKEYYILMLVKVNVNAALQVRLSNMYSGGGTEYSALEVRTGDLLGVYLQENSVQQTIGNSIVGTVTDEQWHLITLFNSETAGVSGIYHNRNYRPYPRTTPGLVGSIDAGFPEFFNYLDGWAQHVAFGTGIPTQPQIDNIYYRIFGNPAAWSASFDFREDFTGDESAPITSPTAGGLTIYDSLNRFTKSGGNLVWTTKTANYNDPRAVQVTAQTVGEGKAIAGEVKIGSVSLGWSASNNLGPQGMAIFGRDTVLQVYPGGLNPPQAVVQGTTYKLAIIKQRLGALYYIKGGAFTDWTPVYSGATNAAAYYNGVSVSETSQASNCNTLRVCTLGGNWLEEHGVAETKLMGKRSVGNTFTHTANCVIDFVIAKLPNVGQTIDFRFRIQDDDNYWQLSIPSNGVGTLNEVVAGTPTLRGTCNAALAVGVKNHLCMYGQIIRLFSSADAQRITYASAANFATETDGKIAGIGTGAIMGNVVVYGTLGAADAAYLDAVFA